MNFWPARTKRGVCFTYPVILPVWARQKFSAERKNKQEHKYDFTCSDRQYLFIFPLYVWYKSMARKKYNKKMQLTSRWFLLRDKLLHVVNIDVTKSVSSVHKCVFVCFSQFYYFLMESRLQNGNIKELHFLFPSTFQPQLWHITNYSYSLFGNGSLPLKPKRIINNGIKH